jgi:hypothetical protein
MANNFTNISIKLKTTSHITLLNSKKSMTALEIQVIAWDRYNIKQHSVLLLAIQLSDGKG